MNITGKWIAAVGMVLMAAGISLPAAAQGCDPASLACYASGAQDRAGDASFLDLVRQGEARSADLAARRDALAQPVAYTTPAAARAPSTENMAPAGVGVLDSAMGTQLANGGEPAWLALPKSIAAPDSSVAWIFALGFLGFVILRRVRATPSY
jgi:hypothetical protein